MLLLRKCGCVPAGETDVEIALREALANAIIHGNHENPRKHVHVRCRCKPDEVSIAVKDEGRGFDIKIKGWILQPQYRICSWPWHLPDESVDG
jgi:anti-sigma regulatory factor (Ser/Thr protein kinase)